MNHQDNAIKGVLKQQLIVDSESGPYKTIQEAIDKAEPNTVIKIAAGLYSSNILINKPGLRLEPKDKNGDIIIVVSSKPTILVDLQKDERCTLIGLKMSHSGTSEEVEELEKLIEGQEIAKHLFGGHEDGAAGIESNPDEEFVNKVPIDTGMNCVVLLNGGKLFMEDCLIALNFIVKSFKGILPGIAINNGAEALFIRCEIKGTSSKNQDAKTIGILLRLGDLIIKDSKVHNHTYGGILIQQAITNKSVRIMNSKIIQNKKVGIHVVGADAIPQIELCRIENNEGPGIKVGIGNKAKIFGNEIKTNIVGIEVLSADPQIFNNKIDKNFTDGILTKVFEQLRCDGKIKSNQTISGNKENGIHCTGQNNYTRIESNTFIGYNKKAGIKADTESRISIFKNKISKNLGQGVLLVETSSAVIEKNEITDNIKANIALGGANSVDTFIVENKILGGRCEGIFLIECGKCWIFRNTIAENNDGIVCITAVPVIKLNNIQKNKSNGIMILKDSRPEIIENNINDNDGIGLFIRDKSHGKIQNNVIKSNEIELVVERRNPSLESIVQENKVSGDIRIPQNYDCTIQ
ncbi:unnamed protein product (macronuclear) [Paramecium tetraurelia]|uniref:Right handed beta helix domain-containing protein n=1 Tax=Paramecium tetraurelia TaxID=5888 RepID=A0DQA9_PARTE|nr:uncharacterized protein GSPATT00002626001 [Paramecium tetraurelia]CAK85226.1 unnamed protein product [Paramecium tetraurelia]|eukprot:XP_001452623.1 hypothetical protein (macronuclear) [Paramecium tetraurelia strain d4-2]